MNYTLSPDNRLDIGHLYSVYPSGSPYLLDFDAIPFEASRSDSSDQPRVIITFVGEETQGIAAAMTVPGSYFHLWSKLHEGLQPPSSAIAVRIANTVSAPKLRYISPREKLEEAISIFSLNVTQTAEVFGVSRTAIYDWLEGKALSKKHQDRISQVYEFAIALKKLDPTPIGEALTWQDEESGQSLLSLFKAKHLEVDRIHQFILALPARIQEWWAPANALIAEHEKDDWAPVPDALRESTRSRLAGRDVRSGKSNQDTP